MRIELWRKMTPDEPSVSHCGICGDDFELGTVSLVGYTDADGEVGHICATCLEYLHRRKGDTEEPARQLALASVAHS